MGVVETSLRHFVDCLRGEVRPVLIPDHARHTLDSTLQAYESIRDGHAQVTQTTFWGAQSTRDR